MKKFLILLLIIGLAPLIGGLYGILNDQLTYSISPEYYQFGLMDSGSEAIFSNSRIEVSVVGFLATWWMGLPIGLILGLVGLLQKNSKQMFYATLKSIVVTVVVAFITGLIGLAYGKFYLASIGVDWWLPDNLIDSENFIAVGSMHNFSYFGGLTGLIAGVIYSIREKRRYAKIREETMTDEERSKYVLTSGNPNVVAFVAKITDENILKDIVLQTNDNVVRRIAMERIFDEKVLEDIVGQMAHWRKKDVEVCKIAIEKITNEDILKNIVLLDTTHYEVCKIIVKKITSEIILNSIASQSGIISIREIAVEKITNEQILAELLINETTGYETLLRALLQCKKLKYSNLLNSFLNEEYLVKIIIKIKEAGGEKRDYEIAWKLLVDLEGERTCETLEILLRNFGGRYNSYYEHYMPKLANVTFLKYCFSNPTFKLESLNALWDRCSVNLFIESCEDMSEARKKEIYKFYKIVDGVIFKSECEFGKHDFVFAGTELERGTYHDGDDWCWESVNVYKCSRCGAKR